MNVYVVMFRIDEFEPWELGSVYGSLEGARHALEEDNSFELEEGGEIVECDPKGDDGVVLTLNYSGAYGVEPLVRVHLMEVI